MRSRCPASLLARTLLVAVLAPVVGMANLARADVDAAAYHPALFAGDPLGDPSDSPSQRIDPNTTDSRFAGVGSLKIASGMANYIGTATPISPYHILTAAHNLDMLGGAAGRGDGVVDMTPDDVSFVLNFGGDESHVIQAAAFAVHPGFTGFTNPNVHDDIAVITLATPLPEGVPIYSLLTTPLSGPTEITMVGYGESGDGVNGVAVGPGASVKRVGFNMADAVAADDEGTAAAEVWYYDFDGGLAPNVYGGPSLGNGRESTLGGGDSGGPAFVDTGTELLLAGTLTFNVAFNGGPQAPLFGSGGGGMLVYPYLDFLLPFVSVPETSSCLFAGVSLLVAAALGRSGLMKNLLASQARARERSSPADSSESNPRTNAQSP